MESINQDVGFLTATKMTSRAINKHIQASSLCLIRPGDRVASPYLQQQQGRPTRTALSFGVVPQPNHSLAGSELPRQTGLCAVIKGTEGSASWDSGVRTGSFL